MYIQEIELHNPKTREELLGCLQEYAGDSKLLAGGTDLVLQMKFNKWPQKHIINIKNVEGLKKIHNDGNYLVIGCNTTLSELLDNQFVKTNYRALWESINELADRQIRNRGTLVGNICNASPAADASAPLLACDTRVSIQSTEGNRVIPLEEFFIGPGKTSLQPTEFVDEILIPLPRENAFSSFKKLGRTYDDIAIINASVSVLFDYEGYCTSSAITMGAVGPTTKKAVKGAALLVGKKLDAASIKAAAEQASEEATPITDVRASAEYRKKMVSVLVERALKDVEEQRKASF